MSKKAAILSVLVIGIILAVYGVFFTSSEEISEQEGEALTAQEQKSFKKLHKDEIDSTGSEPQNKMAKNLSVEDERKKAEDYIVSCEAPLENVNEEQNILNDVDALKANWKASDSSVAKTAFLMLEFGSEENFDSTIIFDAINTAESEIEKKLLSGLFINMCGTLSDATKCITQAEGLTSDIEQSNGALWFSLAALYARQGNNEKVIESLNRVVSSPEYNDYWGEAIRTYDGALESLGITDKQDRALSAIGFAAAMSMPSVSELFELCEKESASRADIGYLCINVGERMASNGKTAITQGLGLGLQRKSYSGLGLDEEVERVREESKNLYQESYSQEVEELMLHDEELFDYWYSSMLDLGERESFRLTRDEAIRKSKDPNYNPCKASTI